MSAALAAVVAATALAALCLLRSGSAVPRLQQVGGPDREPGPGRRAGPSREAMSPALLADAAAALLAAGTSLPRALRSLGADTGPVPELGVVATLLTWGARPRTAWACAPGHRSLRDALALAETTGAPVATVLTQRARETRRARARDEEAAAAALAVRLVLPMGLCGLPAFILLGIVPIGLALAPWG